MGNFVVAAIHIAYMQSNSSEPGTPPDLPETIRLAYLFAPRRRALRPNCYSEVPDVGEPTFMATLRSVVLDNFGEKQALQNGKISLARMRGVLQAALLISPIILLVNLNLAKIPCNREAMLEAAIALGNGKPGVLATTERILWEQLLTLASGTIHPIQILSNIDKMLPWSQINAATAATPVKSWFVIGMQLYNIPIAIYR